MTTTAHFVEQGQYRTTSDFTRLQGLVARDQGDTVWIDSDESSEPVAALLESLGVPRLVVDDVFDEQALPKIEDGDTYLYLVMHGVRREASSPSSLDTVEMDILVGEGWVLTHRSGPMRSVEGLADGRHRGWRGRTGAARSNTRLGGV